MVDTKPFSISGFTRKRLPILIAAAVGAMAVAGVMLVKTDEHLGTAHVPMEQVLAAHPDMAPDVAPDRDVPEPDAGASYAAGAPPAFVATNGQTEIKTGEIKTGGVKTAKASPAEIKPAPGQTVFVIKHTLSVTDPIKYGQWFWNEKDAPATGPIVITVDLDARVLSIFRDGVEIGTTAVLLGTQEKPTPLGIFPITQKDEHHVSNLYDAAMPFMMRLTNDGVSIHATHVQNGYASHGCIGVPLDFAAKIFAAAHMGDKVYITRNGKMS